MTTTDFVMSGSVLVAVLLTLAVLVLPGRPPGVDGSTDPGGGDDTAPRPRPTRRLEVDDVASSMVLLAVALRSGCGVVEAVEAVARVSDGRVGGDLCSVASASRWGIEAGRAWDCADPGWAPVARLLAVAGRAGVPPSRLLVDGARDLRAAELAALDVAGARVGVRLVAPLGLAFLPAFCLTTVVPLVIALAAQVVGGGG